MSENKRKTVLVEVIDAHNLKPKDGEGSASPFVEVGFDNQRLTTSAKDKTLNPVWKEKLPFTLSDPANLPSLVLDINVYNKKRNGTERNVRNFLGKVKIPATSIVKQGEEVLQRYELCKRSPFSHVSGDLGLKLYYVEQKGENKNEDKKGHGNNEDANAQKNKKPQDSQKGQKMARKGGENETEKMELRERVLDFALKETKPRLGAKVCAYDLVEQMLYLYVRVVKARNLFANASGSDCTPFVDVKLGSYKGTTKMKHYEKETDPECNQVFVFSKERLQSSVLEIFVRVPEKDDFVRSVTFDLSEVPTRVPPDSPLAPQWYKLHDKKGKAMEQGELMLSVWVGTQADESFPEAWHSDAACVHGAGLLNIKSKVYLSPKLWYVRVTVMEAQDLVVAENGRGFSELSVKVQYGGQILRTRPAVNRSANPFWNEDLLLVAAEPFEDSLVLTVEDRVGPNKDEVLGNALIPVSSLEKRLDERPVNSKWFNLERSKNKENNKGGSGKLSSRVHVTACLDGGYHVLDESTLYSSDLRATAKQLWRPQIGVLEVGILSAQNLFPMKTKDGKGSTDAYCVAKYGRKWVRSRTILDSFNPKWNEQYTWQVYDPCTVITVGVFHDLQLNAENKTNANSAKDLKIGKVRIRLSTLETNRVYTHSYSLIVLHASGVKKMGEIQLAVRFSSSSVFHMMHVYLQPLLPRMHYLHPFTVNQLENLRQQAMNMVAMRLSRAEPPLRREVVEYMLDVDSHMWNMRRSKANFFRISCVFSGLVQLCRWFDDICRWRNPFTTLLVHLLFLIMVWNPHLILPTTFFYMFLSGLWNFRLRPRFPPHMDARLSHAEAIHPDELDEEFDTFPTSRSADLIRMRYDRLRSAAARIQTVVGDIATQGERLQTLLSWRDPRATALFLCLCIITSVVLYIIPFHFVATFLGLYTMRHTRFRSRLPSASLNFFRRLPSRSDSLI